MAKKKKTVLPFVVIGSVLVAILIIVIIILTTGGKNDSDSPKKVAMGSYSTGFAIAIANVVRLGFIEDDKTCYDLAGLVKKYDANADFFDCSNAYINGEWSGTEKTTVLKLTNSGHTATFVTDKDIEYLESYSFSAN